MHGDARCKTGMHGDARGEILIFNAFITASFLYDKL